jgi:hypothetical protein
MTATETVEMKADDPRYGGEESGRTKQARRADIQRLIFSWDKLTQDMLSFRQAKILAMDDILRALTLTRPLTLIRAMTLTRHMTLTLALKATILR